MSGGSYGYLCYKISDAARQLDCKSQPAYRRAFAKHLHLVAEAMHDVEWVDSSDYGNGDDKKAIMACIKPKDVLNASVEQAQRMIDELKTLIQEEAI